MVIAMKSLWYCPRLVSDEMPTLNVSPTNLSISTINQCCSMLDPRYSLYMVSTNFCLVRHGCIGKLGQDFPELCNVAQTAKHALSSLVKYMGLHELELEVFEKAAEFM